MKKFVKWGVLALTAVSVASCEKSKGEDPEPDPIEPVSTAAYILNQGNYQNPVSGGLFVVDYENKTVQANAFQNANGVSLGDTPQCGVCYGSKIYIGVYVSNTIEIVDRTTLKSLKKISLAGSNEGSMPRGMVASNGKVYVSMYDGYLARLDTLSMGIDASVKVGPNPEIPAIYNGNIYVPNSDGMNPDAWEGKAPYGKTATVINEESFTVTETIAVPENPNEFFANKTGLYLLSKGNYGNIPGALYKMVGKEFQKVTECTIAASSNDSFYTVNDPFYSEETREYKLYDCASGAITKWMPKEVIWPSNVAYDKIADKILVTSYVMNGQYPSYEAPGFVCVYEKDGTFIGKYDIGAGPSCIFFNQE